VRSFDTTVIDCTKIICIIQKQTYQYIPSIYGMKDSEKIEKIEKILYNFDCIPCECFSEIYGSNEICGNTIDLIKKILKGGDSNAV